VKPTRFKRKLNLLGESLQTLVKVQAPTSKPQKNSKFQTPRFEPLYWPLRFGASLELGAWSLELSSPALPIKVQAKRVFFRFQFMYFVVNK
jgi:hypothetical protein